MIQCLGFLLRVSHMRILCLARTKIPDSWKKDAQHNPYQLYRQFRHDESFLSVWGILSILTKSKFLDANKGPTLQAGLCKDNSIRPAMLTLIWTLVLYLQIFHPLCLGITVELSKKKRLEWFTVISSPPM